MNKSHNRLNTLRRIVDRVYVGRFIRLIAVCTAALNFILLYKIKFFWWRLQIGVDSNFQKTSKEEILKFLNRIKLKSSGHELIRIGPLDDGGYVLPDDLEGIAINFSPGVGPVVGFEVALADMGIESFMIDASVSGPPIQNTKFFFEKKYLGANTHGDFISLAEWVSAAEAGRVQSGDYILSMDIEGGEYEVLSSLEYGTLNRFRIVVIEFHDLHLISEVNFCRQLDSIFEKLLSKYVIVNIHANNNAPIIRYKGIKIPPVLELTFLRKDRIRGLVPAAEPNLELNKKNNRFLPDVTLPVIWFS